MEEVPRIGRRPRLQPNLLKFRSPSSVGYPAGRRGYVIDSNPHKTPKTGQNVWEVYQSPVDSVIPHCLEFSLYHAQSQYASRLYSKLPTHVFTPSFDTQ